MKLTIDTIKPEIGKYYRTRDGRCVLITDDDNEMPYPLNGTLDGAVLCWTREGEYRTERVHAADLIAEWEGPIPETQAPAPRLIPLAFSSHTPETDACLQDNPEALPYLCRTLERGRAREREGMLRLWSALCRASLVKLPKGIRKDVNDALDSVRRTDTRDTPITDAAEGWAEIVRNEMFRNMEQELNDLRELYATV